MIPLHIFDMTAQAQGKKIHLFLPTVRKNTVFFVSVAVDVAPRSQLS